MAENTHTFNIDLPVIALYGPHFHTGEDVQKQYLANCGENFDFLVDVEKTEYSVVIRKYS